MYTKNVDMCTLLLHKECFMCTLSVHKESLDKFISTSFIIVEKLSRLYRYTSSTQEYTDTPCTGCKRICIHTLSPHS